MPQRMLFSNNSNSIISMEEKKEFVENIKPDNALEKVKLLEQRLDEQLYFERNRVIEHLDSKKPTTSLWEDVERIKNEIRDISYFQKCIHDVTQEIQNAILRGRDRISVEIYLTDEVHKSDKEMSFCYLTHDLFKLYGMENISFYIFGKCAIVSATIIPSKLLTSNLDIASLKNENKKIHEELVDFFHEECIRAINEAKNYVQKGRKCKL